MWNIIGRPLTNFNYEFEIVEPLSDGNYQWLMSSENYPYDLEEWINENGYIIVHNVRIQHKEKIFTNK